MVEVIHNLLPMLCWYFSIDALEGRLIYSHLQHTQFFVLSLGTQNNSVQNIVDWLTSTMTRHAMLTPVQPANRYMILSR